MSAATIKGVWPVLAIPFTETGQIDAKSLRHEIEAELAQGVEGLVIFGLASEIYKLSEQERREIIEITVTQVNGQVPIIAGTEHTGSEIAAERSYLAQELGVDAVMLYPPTFVRPDTTGIVEYYALVANRLRIPLVVQDAQTWTQVPLPVELLARLQREIPRVRYVKIETMPTGPKISAVIAATQGNLGVLGGYGGLYYMDELERGALGTLIPAALADQFVQIDRLFRQGNREQAARLHDELLPFLLFEMVTLDTLIETQKILLQRAGIFQTSVIRKPHIPMDARQRVGLERFLQRYDFTLLRGQHKHPKHP